MKKDRLAESDQLLLRSLLEKLDHAKLSQICCVARNTLYRAAAGGEIQHATIVLLRLSLMLLSDRPSIVNRDGSVNRKVLQDILRNMAPKGKGKAK